MEDNERNLTLPGNLRYQPTKMKEIFGYDNLYRGLANVEIATLETLGEIGIIPKEEMLELKPHIVEQLRAIPTTLVDQIERKITKHNVRAWVREAQEIINGKLARWVHIPLTSYDPLDTGRILQFLEAYQYALKPSIAETVKIFCNLTKKFSNQLQVGRTHGQHALPITVGFWLATILNRIVYNWEQLDDYSNGLVGKISGAVGTYNAQRGLGLNKKALAQTGKTFEELVLTKVGLEPAGISTQILQPEPLSYFLFSSCMLSAALGQLGRDCRHLMRTEIAEIQEAFESDQVGSSTMPHKRNPLNFENLEGMWIKTRNEFGKVLDTLISEHQRDLVGSSVARDFPIIMINLQKQLDTLLAQDTNGTPFLQRITVNKEACEKNFGLSSHLVLAEPIYIALQMAGYPGDAHELINRKLVPIAQNTGLELIEILQQEAEEDPDLAQTISQIPQEIMELFHHPEQYTGEAKNKALKIAVQAERISNKLNGKEN